MDALCEAIAKIQSDPGNATSATLGDLITCLDAGVAFQIGKLYSLNYSDFSLAIEILKQWRLDSYRCERGLLAQAAADPSMEIDITALRYGRWSTAATPGESLPAPTSRDAHLERKVT
ncbi:MAG: hypothetical protein ABI612_26335 [Betaproteobacteria bacterium]